MAVELKIELLFYVSIQTNCVFTVLINDDYSDYMKENQNLVFVFNFFLLICKLLMALLMCLLKLQASTSNMILYNHVCTWYVDRVN